MEAAEAAVDNSTAEKLKGDSEMKRSGFIPAAVAACALVFTVMGPVQASQKSKNLWRNLAIGAGVVAGHGLITHNGTETLLGAAGAAYSANRYEQDRHHQSQESAARARYHRSYYYSHNGTRYYRTRNLRYHHKVHHYYHHNNGRRYYWWHGHEYYRTSHGERVRVR